jgi:hypothetical protein
MPTDVRRLARTQALRAVAGLAMLCALGSCELPTAAERVQLSVEVGALSYAPGDDIELTLRNASDRSWYYNSICNSDLERRVGGAWVRVYDYLGAGCPLALVVPSSAPDGLSWAPMEVPAGQSVTVSKTIPGDLADGEYRFLAPFSRGGDGSGTRASQPSPTFQVLSFSPAAR